MEVTEATYKVLAIPTTAGTGSEVTNGSVITNPETHEKTWIGHELIMPKVAIIDPELYKGAPKIVTAGCGMDVLAHAVESYVSNIATPFTDISSAEAIKLTMRYLPEVVANGNNMEAWEKMAWASTLAGFSITHVGAMLVHGMGHSLGGRLDMPHGIAMGLCLAPVIRFSWTGNIGKYAKLAELLGVDTYGLSLTEAAEASAEPIEKMLKLVDLDLKLSDFGLKKSMIEELLDDVFGYLKDFFLPPTPKTVTREDVKNLYLSIL